jgi:diguanylate cyclase (GGDEF)-like protein
VTIEPLEQELKQRLPSPHGVALAIMDACRRDDVELSEVSSLVQTDPALTGRLLQQANSAAMGARPVVSVNEAVSRMGLQAVRQLALGFSLIDQYGKGNCAEFDYPEFWSHSLLMGVAMQHIGALLKLGSRDELFTCGLLARVGVLALATAYPKDYGLVLKAKSAPDQLVALERESMHMDHLCLSAALLVDWGLPNALVEPVLFHEDPSASQLAPGSRSAQLCRALHLALQLADFALTPQAQQNGLAAGLTAMAAQTGLDPAEFGVQVDAIVAQWRAMGDKLKVKSAALPPFEEMAKTLLRPDQQMDSPWLRVLVVEDDKIISDLLSTWLRDECNHTVKVAFDGKEAMAVALDFKPHVVITDWRMPVLDGLELCKALRSSEWGQNIYIVMLTSADRDAELVQAFDAGVDDYLTKPVNLPALTARLKAAWRYVRLREAWEHDHERLTRMAAELALSNRRLQLAALTDPLTELSNRRAGVTALTQAWSASTRHGHPLTVISIDIDHFKSINDVYGHAAGDVVLQHIGRDLRAAARKEDTVCRWGGEEFLVISPNVSLADGVLAAERLRKSIATLPIIADGVPIAITVSLGVASWESGLGSQERLLAVVDQALYAAKQGGRNRLVIFSQGALQSVAQS